MNETIGGGGYTNPALPAGSGGGKKFDPNELAPIASMLAALLFAGKGYRGMAAGSAAQTSNVLGQQEEERKRQAAELERQKMIDQWAIDDRARTEKQRQQEETFAKTVEGWVRPMGEETPGKITLTEGQPIGGLSLDGGKFATEDPYKLGVGLNTAVPAYSPTVSGDPQAKLLADLLKASGNAPWAVQKATDYLEASKQPKAPVRDIGVALKSVSPGNPYLPALLQQGLTNEEFDKAASDVYDFEAKRKTPQEMAIIQLEIDNLKARTAASNRSNQPDGGAGGGTPDPNKKYYGTPFVQQWNERYKQYLSQSGEAEADLAAILAGTKKPKNASTLSMEKWFRGQKQGADLWPQYVAESGIYGDPFYATSAGMAVTEQGDTSKAIYNVLGMEDTSENRKLLQQLVDRYNSQHAKDPGFVKHDVGWWLARMPSPSTPAPSLKKK